jgi:O-antigen/teichoic acid export membrane protein
LSTRKITLRAVAEIIGLAVWGVSMIYISRVVGPEYVGFSATTSAVLLLVTRFADGGLTALASQRLARDDNRLETLLSLMMPPKLVCSLLLVACSLAVLQLITIDARLKYFLVISVSMVLFETMAPTWVFVALGRINVASIVRIGQSLVYASSIFFFIHGQDDWRYLPYITLINSASGFLMSSFFLGYFRLYALDQRVFSGGNYLESLWAQYLESFHFLKAELSSYVYTSSDRLILYYFTTPAVVGVYEAAYKVINPFYNINTVISPTMFRDLAQSFKQGKLPPVMARYTFFMCLLTIPLGFFLIYFAADVIQFLYGARFAESASSLAILGFVITFGFTSGILVIPFSAWNMSREYGNAIFWGNLLNMSLNFTLIPLWGAVGAALATLAAKLIVTMVGYRYFRRATAYNILKDFSWFFAASLLSLLAMPLMAGVIANSFVLMGIYASVYALIVGFAYKVHFRQAMVAVTAESLR